VPEFGHRFRLFDGQVPESAIVTNPTATMHEELIRHVVASTGLAPAVAVRLVADVLDYFGETTEQFVRRRHRELNRRGQGNAAIWPMIADELRDRRVMAEPLSERQLRRIVYG
jgi:hypothetical protein